MIFESDNIDPSKLPIPSGWRILVAPVKIQDETTGGIILVEESKKTAEYFVDVGKVLAIGEDAYKHPKFQGGIPIDEREPKPWCKPGDIILYNSYGGKNVLLKDGNDYCKLKVINDDDVLSLINDISVFDFV